MVMSFETRDRPFDKYEVAIAAMDAFEKEIPDDVRWWEVPVLETELCYDPFTDTPFLAIRFAGGRY